MARKKESIKAWKVQINSKYVSNWEERLHSIFEFLAPSVERKIEAAKPAKKGGSEDAANRRDLRSRIQ